jgi:hypothetical protein
MVVRESSREVVPSAQQKVKSLFRSWNRPFRMLVRQQSAATGYQGPSWSPSFLKPSRTADDTTSV